MKFAIKLFVAFGMIAMTGCASYPNYYIKDSTITSQQQTAAAPVGVPYATVPYSSSPVFFIPPVYGWGTGGYWGGGWGGWGGWGWNRGWGCW